MNGVVGRSGRNAPIAPRAKQVAPSTRKSEVRKLAVRGVSMAVARRARALRPDSLPATLTGCLPWAMGVCGRRGPTWVPRLEFCANLPRTASTLVTGRMTDPRRATLTALRIEPCVR